MYEGEVYTYRGDRAPRTVTANRQQRAAARTEPRADPRPEPRSPAPDPGDATVLRLERRLARLEESLAELSGVVDHLREAVEALEDQASARAKGGPGPDRGAQQTPLQASRVTVQMQNVVPEEPASPPPSDVKVSLYGSSSTEAILGHVRITQQS